VRPAALRATVEHVLARVAPWIQGDVGVAIVSDRAMRGLNYRFRGRNTTTDVLAFPLGDGLRTGEPFGDIAISYETAVRQAHDYAAPIGTELTRLVVHATLHLCGYDHHERRQAAHMHALTRKLLRELTADA